MGRRAAIGLLVALAAGGGLARPARAATIIDVAEPIEAFTEGLVRIMREGKQTPFPQRYTSLAPAAERLFDLPEIARESVGLRWDTLRADERTSLVKAMAEFSIASWVANFDKYDGERFDIEPRMRPSGADEVVTVKIQKMDGGADRLDFVMRDEGGQWRAVDILLDGTISRVAVQRSDFRSLLTGDNAAALIASLHQKVSDLSGGTMHT